MKLYAVVSPEGDVPLITTVTSRAVELANGSGTGFYVVEMEANGQVLISVANPQPPIITLPPEEIPAESTPLEPLTPSFPQDPVITEPENPVVTEDLTGDPVPLTPIEAPAVEIPEELDSPISPEG